MKAFPVSEWGLRELTLAAFFYHPQLDVARAQLHESRVAIMNAGQKINPGLSTGVEHHSNTSGGISPWTMGLSFDITIETGDKRAIRIEQATNLSDAARLEIGQTAWDIRSRLRTNLLEYLASITHSGFLQRELAIRYEMVQMLETRFNAGMISSVELGSARLQLQKTQQLLDAEAGRIPELKAMIATSAGLPAQSLLSVPILPAVLNTLPALEQLPGETTQRAALLNRLDIRAALARYASAESALKLEIAKQRPDITLSPGYSFDQGDNRWSLGLSLILALLNKNEGPIAQANARRASESANFDALQTTVIAEQEQSLARYRAALDEIAAAERMLQSQQQQFSQTQRQFDSGFSDRLEFTGARLEMLEAEKYLLTSKIKAQKILGALEDAIQQPLDEIALPEVPEQKEPHA